jgi:hypothetical protein
METKPKIWISNFLIMGKGALERRGEERRKEKASC